MSVECLRQGTAVDVSFGPFAAKGNGVTVPPTAAIITSIDHATTGIMLEKAGGAQTIRHQAVTPSTYSGHGFFKVRLDATDVNTLGGLMMIHSEPATYLPVWRAFMVMPAQVWDSLFGSDKLDVNVAEQANIDFGALQKASLNAATPASVQNIPATGSGFTALGANLDASVSSRSTYAGGAVASVTSPVEVATKTGFSLAVTPPTVAQIDTQLSSTHGSGTWGTGVGSSSLDVIITSSGEPIEGIMVEVYTSSAKTGFVRKTTTDGAGLAHFDIIAGTYYVWVLHSDYTGTNPTAVTVT
jgi:hypothetical protein